MHGGIVLAAQEFVDEVFYNRQIVVVNVIVAVNIDNSRLCSRVCCELPVIIRYSTQRMRLLSNSSNSIFVTCSPGTTMSPTNLFMTSDPEGLCEVFVASPFAGEI